MGPVACAGPPERNLWRLRTLALTAAVGLVIALVPTTAAQAAAPYRVTATISSAKADVGQRVVITGRVSGPLSARKKLLVQRKIGAGAWTTVRTVRTTKKSRYAAVVSVPTAGAQSLRVIAPRSKKRALGVSAVRNLVGWRWLDLTTQPRASSNTVTTGPVSLAGRTYPRAFRFSNSGAQFTVGAGCTTVTAGLGRLSGATGDEAGMARWEDNTTPPVAEANVRLQQNAAPMTVTISVRGDSMVAIGGDQGTVAVAPRMYCPLNTLPQLNLD